MSGYLPILSRKNIKIIVQGIKIGSLTKNLVDGFLFDEKVGLIPIV
jgi:hypothetical protein